MTLRHLSIDRSWTLFLDRDGVINRKLPGDYVKSIDAFEFLDGVPVSIATLGKIFGKIFVVTNQQGIGKGLMTDRDLEEVHNHMMEQILFEGGRIDKIYYSPYREEEKSVFRKPGVGMARKAKIDFPGLEFKKSLMVGDSASDMLFGKNAGMHTVFIGSSESLPDDVVDRVDYVYPDLKSLTAELSQGMSL